MTSAEQNERLRLLKGITLKNVVMGRGHDCGGLIADIYLKKKLVSKYHDDGWGGEPEITFITKEDEEKVVSYITDNKVEEHMVNTDWSDLNKDGKGIGFFTTLEASVDLIASHMERLKQIRRLQTKSLVLEKDGDIYTKKFKFSIAQIKKNPLQLSSLLGIIKKEKAEGYEVLNTNL
tara:strand:+ start:603 stop:1133 length:531 start_codon:yes stop_codon:yes gene_type:complete